MDNSRYLHVPLRSIVNDWYTLQDKRNSFEHLVKNFIFIAYVYIKWVSTMVAPSLFTEHCHKIWSVFNVNLLHFLKRLPNCFKWTSPGFYHWGSIGSDWYTLQDKRNILKGEQYLWFRYCMHFGWLSRAYSMCFVVKHSVPVCVEQLKLNVTCLYE